MKIEDFEKLTLSTLAILSLTACTAPGHERTAIRALEKANK